MPAEVYDALASEAAREHRSLARQAVVALQRGMAVPEEPRARRRALLAEIAADPADGTVRLASAAALMREDRGR